MRSRTHQAGTRIWGKARHAVQAGRAYDWLTQFTTVKLAHFSRSLRQSMAQR
jgi:hypothetical protein